MKLHNDRQDVVATGVLHASTARIEMNAKAFRVLSDNLYQNKIGSIVREISCNALDAHTAAGHPEKPFDIHLPDAFEPWFSVKDYGTGISHDDMERIYMSYFSSTKDDSDTQIGAFGLGGKSPWAYQDTFVVTSRQNGMKRTYSAYIDGSGMPTIALMSEDETDEPNGLEVQIAVREQDIHRFRDEVKKQLRFFKVRPNLNSSTFEWDKWDKPLIDNEDFSFFSSNTENYIIQGQVGYPLDYHQVATGISPENKTFFAKFAYERGIHLHFDIGEIEVTASREGIQYRDFTLKNIDKRITKCRESVADHVLAQLASCATEWDKVALLNSDDFILETVLSTGADLGLTVATPTTYWNNKITGYKFDIEHLLTKQVTRSITDANGNVTTNTDKVRTAATNIFMQSPRTGKYSSGRNTFTSSISPDIRITKIVIRDTTMRPVVRIKKFCEENQIHKCLVIHPDDLNGFDADAFIAKLKAALGGFDAIYKVSDMPVPPKAARAPGAGNPRPTCYIRTAGNLPLNSTASWERGYEALDDMDDGGYYVIVDRYNVDLSDIDHNNALLLERNGYLDGKEIIAIRKNDEKKIEDNPEWIPLTEVVNKHIESIKGDHRVKRAILARQLHVATNKLSSGMDEFISHNIDSLGKDNICCQYIRLKRIAERAHKRYGEHTPFAHLTDVERADWIDRVAEMPEAMRKEYPLIARSLTGYGFEMEHTEHMLLYIKAVDNLNASRAKPAKESVGYPRAA